MSIEGDSEKKIPFLKFPGRAILKDEAVAAVVSGVIIVGSAMSGNPIVQVVGNGVGFGISATVIDLMFTEGFENEENLDTNLLK